MSATTAQVVAPTDAAIAEAARLLCEGCLVAFPTETVYGLGADATSDVAVAALYRAKGRPERNPLIIHCEDIGAAEPFAAFDERARNLGRAFWPGALTLVLPRRASSPVSPLATAGLATVAVRVPNHPVALALLRAARRPLAAPSANRSGHVSPTTAQHVIDGLDGRVELVLDGGPCSVGIESTVVALDGPIARLLRPGGIVSADIERVLGTELAPAPAAPPDLQSPGQMESHYAPRVPLRLNAITATGEEGALTFGARRFEGAKRIINLSARGDLAEAAANLYAAMRTLDDASVAAIAVAPIPDQGLGAAINDRLRRAAAPRVLPSLPDWP